MLSSDHEKEKLDAASMLATKGLGGLSFISGSGLAQDCGGGGGLMQLNGGIAVNYGQK